MREEFNGEKQGFCVPNLILVRMLTEIINVLNKSKTFMIVERKIDENQSVLVRSVSVEIRFQNYET